MPHVKNISRVGNSAGLTLDQPILKQVGWAIGTQIEIRVQGEDIVLSPHRHATNEQARAAGKKVVQQRRGLLERLAKR